MRQTIHSFLGRANFVCQNFGAWYFGKKINCQVCIYLPKGTLYKTPKGPLRKLKVWKKAFGQFSISNKNVIFSKTTRTKIINHLVFLHLVLNEPKKPKKEFLTIICSIFAVLEVFFQKKKTIMQ